MSLYAQPLSQPNNCVMVCVHSYNYMCFVCFRLMTFTGVDGFRGMGRFQMYLYWNWYSQHFTTPTLVCLPTENTDANESRTACMVCSTVIITHVLVDDVAQC